MTKQVRMRRGSSAQHASFIGADGEVTVDTTNKTLRVHDGVTTGGNPVTTNDRLSASSGAGTIGSINGLTVQQNITNLIGASRTAINARRYGSDGFGSLTAYTAQVQAAANAAVAAGVPLYFESGADHEIGDITVSGRLMIVGDGAGFSKIILKGTNHGWVINVSNQYPDVFISRGITFKTNGTTGIALDINCIYTGGPFYSQRDERKVLFDDTEFVGVDPKANGWTEQVKVRNVNGAIYLNSQFRGRNDTNDQAEATNTISDIGVNITSTSIDSLYGGSHRFIGCTFYGLRRPVAAGGLMEGILLDSCDFINTGWFIDWIPIIGAGGRPGLKIVKCHGNTYYGIARVNAVQQIEFDGNYVYDNVGTADVHGPGLDFTVNTTTDVITCSSYQFYNGESIVFVGGTPPGGTSLNTRYYVRDAGSYNGTFKIATTDNGTAINLTSNATGCQIKRFGEWVGFSITDCTDVLIDNNTYIRTRAEVNTGTTVGVRIRGASTKKVFIGDGENYGGGNTGTGPNLDICIDANDSGIPARTIRFPTPGKPVFEGNYRVGDILLPSTNQIFGDVRQAVIRLTTQQDYGSSTTPTGINWGANGTVIEDSIGISIFGTEIAFPTETFGRNLQVKCRMRWARLRNDTIVGVNQRGAVLMNDSVVITRRRIEYDPDGDTYLDIEAEFSDDDGGLTSILAWQNSGNTMKLAFAEIIYRLI